MLPPLNTDNMCSRKEQKHTSKVTKCVFCEQMFQQEVAPHQSGRSCQDLCTSKPISGAFVTTYKDHNKPPLSAFVFMHLGG